MKKNKGLIPSFILAFAISFMLFFVEPITLYANNINDFWFDFYIMILPVLLMFFCSFILISLVFTIIYFISKKLLKKVKIYCICLLSAFVLFLYLYIQGNYLIGDLPPLDGTFMDWSKYSTQNIISLMVFILLIVGQVILVLKFKWKKSINIVKYISLVVVGMLTTSLVSVMLTTDMFDRKNTPITYTYDNIHKASSNTNFFIFIADAVDSIHFYDVLKESDEYKNLFEDFTYFPDTVAAYPFTRDSLPFILTGVWNTNETEFKEYSIKELNKSKILNTLSDNGFNINVYDDELVWEKQDKFTIENYYRLERKVNFVKFVKQELKYILFKYLPYNLKKYSKIEEMDFDFAKPIPYETIFNGSNIELYNRLENNDLEIVEDKLFSLIHTEGAHVPFNHDENLNYISSSKGTYDGKILGTLKLLKTYLNRLKTNDVYDNSIIIVMADHGYNFDDTHGRQNPILLIKGLNEKHSMKKSNKPISFVDLQDAYFELLEGKKSNELFNNVEKNRERRFIFYKYTKEDYMYEYIQTGKAWDESTLIKTGNEYILK